MKEGWVADIVKETTVINLNAIRRIDFCDLLRSNGHFLRTLRMWLRKHGVPFWNDGKYFVETKRLFKTCENPYDAIKENYKTAKE